MGNLGMLNQRYILLTLASLCKDFRQFSIFMVAETSKSLESMFQILEILVKSEQDTKIRLSNHPTYNDLQNVNDSDNI